MVFFFPLYLDFSSGNECSLAIVGFTVVFSADVSAVAFSVVVFVVVAFTAASDAGSAVGSIVVIVVFVDDFFLLDCFDGTLDLGRA